MDDRGARRLRAARWSLWILAGADIAYGGVLYAVTASPEGKTALNIGLTLGFHALYVIGLIWLGAKAGRGRYLPGSLALVVCLAVGGLGLFGVALSSVKPDARVIVFVVATAILLAAYIHAAVRLMLALLSKEDAKRRDRAEASGPG